MQQMDPLANLRDIHLPAPVSAWQIAPGWWVLIGLGVTVLTVSLLVGIRYHRRYAWRRAAAKQLKALQALGDGGQQLAGLSILLRRVALANFPRAQVAPLCGEAWLAFLDATGRTRNFTEGPGRLFASAPYRAPKERDLGALFEVVSAWVAAVDPKTEWEA